MNFNIFFPLYFLSIFFSLATSLDQENNSQNIISFPFKRNITFPPNNDHNKLMTELFYNQLYINFTVGSEKLVIPFYLYLKEYETMILSNNLPSDQVHGIYNPKKSSTYEALEEESQFTIGDIVKGTVSLDDFIINKENNIKLPFYLVTETAILTHFTVGGRIGLEMYQEFEYDERTNFLNNLKKNNLISYPAFYFKYDTNKLENDDGKIIFGSLPHKYDSGYNEEYYINAFSIMNKKQEFEWGVRFEYFSINNTKTEGNFNGYFYPEIGYIIPSRSFYENFKNSSFYIEILNNTEFCQKTSFTIFDFEATDNEMKPAGMYKGYYCKKSIDESTMPEISVTQMEMNYTFTFNGKDLFMEKGEYKYFLLPELDYDTFNWIFGKPFFKKYQIYFDADSKKIGLYTKFEEGEGKNKGNEGKEKKKNIALYLIICGLVVIIIILGFIIYKCYLNLPRKQRANELDDDNFDYSGQPEDEKNRIN